jgi:hypothetical protein
MRIESAFPMVGLVTEPKSAWPGASRTGAIVLNAGLIHHVGPNRLTVRIARQLAALGHVVARFDHGGIGDSGPRRDDSPFAECAVEETLEVMAHLQRQNGVDSFWLTGLCSGAVTALRTACADKRIVGTVLINGGWQGGGGAWDVYVDNRWSARDYWNRKLFSVNSWKNLLSGRSQYRRLGLVLANQLRDNLLPETEVKTYSDELATLVRSLVDRGVRLMSVMSQGDRSRAYLDAVLGSQVRELEATGSFRQEVVPFADHLFTTRSSQQRLLRAIAEWVGPAPGMDGPETVL